MPLSYLTQEGSPKVQNFIKNTTCIDSSTFKALLLKTLYVLLVSEYPKKIASSALESNFPKFSFPLFNTTFASKKI